MRGWWNDIASNRQGNGRTRRTVMSFETAMILEKKIAELQAEIETLKKEIVALKKKAPKK
uniref:Uncharacterized protein n=1 Tax=viral metagenome TaxID=1070528 RepID=A0A6H1ZXL0_9ZZZZ